MKVAIQDHTGLAKGTLKETVLNLVEGFAQASNPLEPHIVLLRDARTGAMYVECHIRASKLIELGTVDVPLDPDEQAEYRANRELVEDHVAFAQMKDDAIH